MSHTEPSPELEARLRRTLADVIPTLHDNPVEPAPARRLGRPQRALGVAAAVVLVAIGGLVFVRARSGEVVTTVSPEPTAPVVTSDPAPSLPVSTVPDEILIAPIDIEWPESDMPTPPWDPISIAPGTFWRYEVDISAVSADLRAQVGDPTSLSDGFASMFYTCSAWDPVAGSVADNTLAASDVTCNQLSGGYREVVQYGEQLAVGSGTGRSDWAPAFPHTIEQLLGGLSEGSLWSYDTQSDPPNPRFHDIEGIVAVSHRSADQAYLVLEPEPGEYAWLRGNGLDDEQLLELAAALRRVPAPRSLNVPLGLGPEMSNDGSSDGTQMKLIWLDGRPCVGIRLWERCTPADLGPTLVRGYRGSNELLPSIGAIVAEGGTEHLAVQLFGLDGPTRVDRAFVGLGIETWTFWPGTERMVSATLSGSDGETLGFTTWTLESIVGSGAADVLAEGRTSGTAWVAVRQDPASPSAPEAQATSYFGGGYCWLLHEAGGGFAGLCPTGDPPATGLGAFKPVEPTVGILHETLSLVEVADDVTELRCGRELLPIIADPGLDGRRFAITPCGDPEIVR